MIEFLNWWAESNYRVAFALILIVGLYLLIDSVVGNICNTVAHVKERKDRNDGD